MRMLHPSLGHQSPEDRDCGEWEGCGWGVGTGLPLHQVVFCAGKGPRAGKTCRNLCPSVGKHLRERPLAEGPGAVPGKVWKAWAEAPRDGVRKGMRRLQGLFSVVLDFAYPNRLFFPSFAKYFSEPENNLNV